jgi:gamma-glutamyl:cysteine ligase YbdK (ATP-grasp superfamily)
MPAGSPERARNRPLGLFDAYGVELEYMIVDAATLDVAPVADALLETVAGEPTDEYLNGEVAWNNELALHVLELKCNGPRDRLAGLGKAFGENVVLANDVLARSDRRLMPSAMHPWMDPARELVLWPHGSREIYRTFDRIFACRGHGWANLQSAHLNLPFAGDEQFARLHTAIRLLLPLLPGLAASSPLIDGKLNGILDNRLVAYRQNCARIPSITAEVVPEPIQSIGEYQEKLLAPLYRDLAPHDPAGVLRHEWVNARGAIARFERMTIEIRVLDVQESPPVDAAYASLIIEVLKLMCAEQWSDLDAQREWPTAELGRLLRTTEREAENSAIDSRRYLEAFGFARGAVRLVKLWEHLIDAASTHGELGAEDARLLEHYLRHGTLATRIVKGVGRVPRRETIAAVYRALCDALAAGEPFAFVQAPR